MLHCWVTIGRDGLKLCLSKNDRAALRTQLKKWGVLGKDWNPYSIDTVINHSVRPEKVREMIGMMEDDNTKD